MNLEAGDTGCLEIRAYCKCGNRFHVKSEPPMAAKTIERIWWDMHQGSGHGETTRADSDRARRRREPLRNDPAPDVAGDVSV